MPARNRRIAIVVLAVAAIVLLWGVLRHMRRGEQSPRYVERNPAHRVARAQLSAAPAGPAASVDGPPGWLLERGIAARRIAGVVLADGKPLPGALVSLRSEVFASQGLKPPMQTSNATGHFDFGEQLPGTYAAIASTEERRPGVVIVNLRDPARRPPPAELEIELSRCTSRSYGIVRDVRGFPIGNATVSVNGRLDDFSWFQPAYEAHTRADGSFSICSAGRQLLWVAAAGYGTVWLRGDMPRGGWEVRLLGEGRVEGIVLSSSSQPISGARVVIMPADSTEKSFEPPLAQTSFSAADGTFAIDGLLPGTFEIAADHGSYHTNWPLPTVTVRSGGVVHDVIIEMGSCRSLAGVVLEGERPIVGASVGHVAITQDDGSFVVSCAQYESLELTVEKHDVLNPTVPAGTESIDDLVIRVRARASVSGRVTANGVPIAKALVAVGNPTGWLGMPAVFGEHHRTRSDEHGAYELAGLPVGSHEINAWDPHSKSRSRPTVVRIAGGEDVDDIDLELANAGIVRGVVVDREGRHAANVSVELIGGSQARKRSVFELDKSQFKDETNQQGEFELRGLSSASYDLCLNGCREGAAGAPYLPLEGESWPPVLVTSGDAAIELRLVIRGRTGLAISGNVTYGNSGEPCPAAAVRANYDRAPVLTDSAGNYVLTDLDEGNYTVKASAQDGSSGQAKEIAAGSSNVTITVERPGTLRGVITGGDGECRVEATGTRGTAQGGQDASSGRYVATSVREFDFAGIAPGEYRVHAVCLDGVASSLVAVPPGETVSITLEAGPGGSVRGIVRLFPSGSRAGDLECSLAGVSAHTQADGSFQLEQVPPGPGQIYCGKWSTERSTSGSAQVEIRDEQPANVEVFVVEGTPFAQRPDLGGFGAQLRLDETEEPDALRFTALLDDGPAARAGIQVGDLLLTVDGGDARGPRTAAALSYFMAQPPGTTLRLSIRRGEDALSMSLTMGRLEL